MPLSLKPQKHKENLLDEHHPFFILSLGRSGSYFLADLLNRERDLTVLHEPTRLDFFAYLFAYYNPDLAPIYLNLFRKRFISHKIKKDQIVRYGEVNSLLRRHYPALKQTIPSVKIIFLARDGRDVVRSMMARRTFTHRDPITSMIRPRPGDELANRWSSLDRFEKLCWYWQEENKYLLDQDKNSVHLEKIVTDFDYFTEMLLNPLQISIPKSLWQEIVTKPKNITSSHVFPHWTKWSTEQTEIFDRICGKVMKRLGYSY